MLASAFTRPCNFTVRWQRGTGRSLTFGTHVLPHTAASWLSTVGACGIVRAVPGSERSYTVTVRRAGAMEYLETLLREGERREVLARQYAAS